jgi:hypothetical protein
MSGRDSDSVTPSRPLLPGVMSPKKDGPRCVPHALGPLAWPPADSKHVTAESALSSIHGGRTLHSDVLGQVGQGAAVREHVKVSVPNAPILDARYDHVGASLKPS